jgi:hypothetical protein
MTLWSFSLKSVAGIAFLRIAWALVSHYKYLRCSEKRFVLPQGQTLLRRTLVDVCLSSIVAFGEGFYALTRPRIALRILRAQARSLNYRYGPHPRHSASVFAPSSASLGPNIPIILFVRGGAWAWGNRVSYGAFCEQLSSAVGAIVVNIDYRAYPHGNCRDMTEDVVRVLAWIRQHAHQWGGDKNRITLLGHSAGAHLVMNAVFTLAISAAAQPMDREEQCDVALCQSLTTPATAQQRHASSLPDELAGVAPELLGSLQAAVGVAGVYHIQDHSTHEDSRDITLGPLCLVKVRNGST